MNGRRPCDYALRFYCIDFLSSIHVLSVPTSYKDPKGRFVLEALAHGVPVVQPAHGAFPELVEAYWPGKDGVEIVKVRGVVRAGDDADVFQIDRRYWESLWYRVKPSSRP